MIHRFGTASRLLLASCVVLALCLCAGCGGGDEEQDQQKERAKASGQSTEHLDAAGKSLLPVVYPKGPKAPKPTSPLPEKASCVTAECHADMTQAAHVHGPVAKQSCDSCHGADTGGHVFPLKRRGDAMCTFCHTVSGTQSHQHKALEKGCETCHKPHTSETKFLLNEPSIGQVCMKCHTLPMHRYAHQAFADGNCTNCHWPHQSDTKALLRGGEGREACLTCHDKIRTEIASLPVVHKPATGECQKCHEPHSAENPKLLAKPVLNTCLACHEDIAQHIEQSPVKHGAMISDNQCANCHTAHASEEKHLVRARMDKVCLTCHDKAIKSADGRTIPDMKGVLTEAKFLHGPVKSGSCSGCHDPHGSKFPNLLDRAFPDAFYTSFDVKKYDLCFKCHDSKMVLDAQTTQTGFRSGDRNLHFVHVNRAEKGRTCRTCHEVHGSDLPKHMAADVPFEGSKWAMPIEYEQLPNGGRCTPGCHQTQTYIRGGATTAPTTRGAE